MAGNFFRGTTAEQDPRWGDSEKKLLVAMTRSGKFPAIYESKVDISKVNVDIMNKWITEKLTEILGFEDDIVINLAINILTDAKLDAKRIHLSLAGFLEKQTQSFVEELWSLLVDAQGNVFGIPSAFLEKKKTEMQRRTVGSGSAEQPLRSLPVVKTEEPPEVTKPTGRGSDPSSQRDGGSRSNRAGNRRDRGNDGIEALEKRDRHRRSRSRSQEHRRKYSRESKKRPDDSGVRNNSRRQLSRRGDDSDSSAERRRRRRERKKESSSSSPERDGDRRSAGRSRRSSPPS